MCAQCMATAATVVGSAAGIRAYAAGPARRHLSPRALRWATAGLMVLAFVAVAVV